jgi:hypothetical protein
MAARMVTCQGPHTGQSSHVHQGSGGPSDNSQMARSMEVMCTPWQTEQMDFSRAGGRSGVVTLNQGS